MIFGLSSWVAGSCAKVDLDAIYGKVRSGVSMIDASFCLSNSIAAPECMQGCET